MDDKPKPTLDERLDALTQALEILQSVVHSRDRGLDKITEGLKTSLVAIKGLEMIATTHEHRIQRLEGE